MEWAPSINFKSDSRYLTILNSGDTTTFELLSVKSMMALLIVTARKMKSKDLEIIEEALFKIWNGILQCFNRRSILLQSSIIEFTSDIALQKNSNKFLYEWGGTFNYFGKG